MQFAAGSVKVGDVLCIQGKFQTNDEKFVIDFEETKIVFKGEKSSGVYYWQMATAADLANYTEVSVTEAISPSGYSSANARYEFYFRLDKNTGIDYDTKIDGLQYRINSEEAKPLTAFIASHGGGTLFVVIPMEEAKNDTQITILGKAISSADDSKGVALKENVTIYVNQYGWSLNEYNRPTEYANMNVNEFYANVSKYANAEQGWHFYLGLDGKNSNIDFESELIGFTYSINGGSKKELKAWYSSYQEGSLFFIMPDLGKTIGKTKITISGKAATKDGKKGIALTDSVTLYGNEYGWSLTGYPAATTYIGATAKSINNASKWNAEGNSGRWDFYVYLNGNTSKLPKDAMFTGFEYTIDGKKKALSECFWSSHADGTLLVVIRDLPKDIKKNTKIVVSGKAKTADGKYGIKLTKNITLYGNQYGWSLNEYNRPTEYANMNVNEFYANVSKYANAEQGWHFYLGLDGKNSNIDFESELIGFTYSINGGSKKELKAWYSSYQEGSLFFIMPDLGKTIGKTKITISGKAATKDGKKGIALTDSVTLYGNEYGWSLTGYPAATTYIGATAKSINNASKWNAEGNSGRWDFYVYLNGNTSKLPKDAMFTGFEYTIDGKKKALSECFWSSHADGTLLVVIRDLPKDIKKNTKIVVSGKAKTADGKYGIKLTKNITLYGNQYGWSLTGYPAPTKYVKTTIKSINNATQWNVYKGDARWDIYLNPADKNSDIPFHSPLSGFEYSINGGRRKSLDECFWSPHSDGSILLVVRELKKNIKKNTKVVITGKAKTSDGKYGIELTKPVTLYANEYGWSLEGYLKKPTYTAMNFKKINNATTHHSETKSWHIYFDMDKKMPGEKDSPFYGMQMEVNGKVLDVTVYHASYQDTLFFMVEDQYLPANAANGTKIVLKAGKAHQNGTAHGISLNKDITLYKFFDGMTTTKPTTNTKYTKITTTTMARATKFSQDAKIWQLFLRSNQTIPGDEGTVFYNLKAVLNGKEVTLKATKEGDYLYVSFGEDILSGSAKTGKMSFKAGATAIGDGGHNGVKFAQDFDIYLFNGVWSEEEFEEVIETELYCTRLENYTHTKGETLWGFYFKTNAEFPGINWYNKFDKFQVELNGKPITVELNKAQSSNSRLIYFGVDESVVGKFEEGSIITINKNSIAEDGGYKNTFTKDFSIIYENGMWIEYRKTKVKAPKAQNLWDVARFDSAYIPQSKDGTVLIAADNKYNSITSFENMMDYTVSFTGKKFADAVANAPFHIILRGNPISSDEPVSRSLLYGYVITFEGYEITKENTPKSPELWGTRSGFINVWKNGENPSLASQYRIGTHQAMENDPYFKYNETYQYEVSIYNITDTAVCIEFKVNGEVVFKCYDDASTDPMDPAVNAGLFGIYAGCPTYIGGETVELDTILAEASECTIGDKVGLAVTYPSIVEGAQFTVDKKGAIIEDGVFVAEKAGVYKISATYKGKTFEPITIEVKEGEESEVTSSNSNGMNMILLIVVIAIVVIAGLAVSYVLFKRKRKREKVEV